MSNNLKCIKAKQEYFCGAISFEYSNETVRPWRLEVDKHDLYIDQGLLDNGRCSAGIRLRAKTNSRHLGLKIAAVPECHEKGTKRQYDLVVDNELIETKEIGMDSDEELLFGLPLSDDEIYEIWFSPVSPTDVKYILIDDAAKIEPVNDRQPRWITYGSSITRCGGAYSPARTWPAIVSRARNLNLTCLGYGGQCHMDPLVAMMIRNQQADIISLKLGINIQASYSLSRRTFAPAVIGFVETIREKHPDIPILLISPIYSPPRETVRNEVGLSLTDIRKIIADCSNRLKQAGDKHIYSFNGLDLLGESDAQLLPDECHPNGQGYELIGQRFLDKMFDPIAENYVFLSCK